MQIQENISIKKYNTFGVDVAARYFSSFSTIAELEALLATSNQQLATLILGGGSNILFTKNYNGLVLKNELKGITLVSEDADFYYVKAAAGEEWHNLVQYCTANNYAGIENLSLIPGSVGASPIQNIGAYGVEIKDVFHSLEAYHINNKCLVTFSLADCQFGYRESIFKHQYKGHFIILNVTHKLRKQPIFNTNYGAIHAELEKMGVTELSVQHISQAVINIRTSKLPDPKLIGNAGSFFKNPQISKFRLHVLKEQYEAIPAYVVDAMHYKIAAGWLIEQCGWKGFRKGDAGCSSLQALVLVNYGNATGQEIVDLSTQIITSVVEKFGIILEREVNII